MLCSARERWYTMISIRTHAGLYRRLSRPKETSLFSLRLMRVSFRPHSRSTHSLGQPSRYHTPHVRSSSTPRSAGKRQAGESSFFSIPSLLLALPAPWDVAAYPGRFTRHSCGLEWARQKFASLSSLLQVSSIIALISCGTGLSSPVDAKICKDPTARRRSGLRHEMCKRRAALGGGESPRNTGQQRGMTIQMSPAGACLLVLSSLCSAVEPLCLLDQANGTVVRQESGIDVIQMRQRHKRDSRIAWKRCSAV